MRKNSWIALALMFGALLLALSGCKNASSDGGSPEGGASAQEESEKATPLVWRGDHDAALAEAAKAGSWAVVDFSAEWCAPCKRLEKETFTDPAVIKALEGYVRVRVDGTESVDDVAKEMDRHRVETYPAIVFVRPDGTTLSTPRVEDFVGPKDFLALLAQVK